jgi:polyvinyl alcohol dehydrogenase (cytochrome)
MLKQIVSGAALAAALGLASCSTSDTQVASSDAAVTAPHSEAATAAAKAGGEQAYKTYCAACHDNPEATKAPSRETLARMTSGQITNALITGKMIAQAGPLTSQQISYVSDYLSDAAAVDDSWITAMRCPASRRTPKLDAQPTVQTFGFDIRNTRNLSYAQAGLKPADFANLEVAWVVAFPDVVTMRSQAAVVGDTIIVPAGESKNRVFAFDISDKAKPCIQWVYEGTRTIRTSAGYGVRKDGRKVVMVGDMGAYIHMIDAKTGKQIWESHMGLFPQSTSTATPVLVGDKVIAPSSQYEIMMAAQLGYECCKVHGGVVALDAMTGRRVWEGHTMEQAKPIRDRGDGKMLWGPAGAPVWNSPSIDLKRNRVYVGTGEANSETAHKNTDALMSFDLKDGSIKWAHQATENDVYNVGCGPNGGSLNCSKNTVYRDVDFGASTILATATGGKEIVVAGQKSGTVWAMDPDTGAVVWKTHIGTGGANGGIHWGIAVDDTHVYAPISYPGRSIPGQDVPADLKPGLYAVNLKDGSIDWKFEVAPDCTPERRKFVPGCARLFGLSGAPTVIGDHIVSGGLDGRIYIVERKTGKLVSQLETARDFDTVNGVKGNGASVDNASIIAANGLLILNSGYGLFGQGAGNVMIAFKPKS